MARVEITSREKKWLALMALAVMLAASVPYVVGWLNATPSLQYGGFIVAHEDMHSYLAKMRFGARSGWLFELVYTSEPHSGALVFAFHLALGKLTGAISGYPVSTSALIVTYHTARLLMGLLLLVVSYRFIAEFITEVAVRRLAWTVVAVGGGLGWLTLAVFGADWLGTLPNEFYIPEGYTFLTLFSLPHLALARSLLLIGWLLMLHATQHHSWRLATLAGLAWFAMGVVVPFYVALVFVLLAAWMIGLWLHNRRLPLKEGLLAGVAAAISGITLAYTFWAFTSNPVFRVWAAQNLLASPHPLHYVAGYGVLAVLAIKGFGSVWRGNATRGALLTAWVLIVPILVYLPINVQRRLIEGFIVPLSILAAIGLARLTSEWRLPRRKLATIVLVAMLMPSSIVLVLGSTASVAASDWPAYHSPDELASFGWLVDNAESDSIVLSTFEQGNVVPAYSDVRVYAGHGPETVDSLRKLDETAAFFGNGMTDNQRIALLTESRASYVLVGPQEQAACDSNQCLEPHALGLKPVFSQGDYIIYEVGP